MPNIVKQLQEQTTRDENEAIDLAARRATWANQFNSYTPDEKLRENLDVENAIAGALRRRQELEARTSLKAQEILHRQTEHEEWKRQAPLRDALQGARVVATGATERRRAEQARLEAEQTGRLNTGVATLYNSGLHPTSPEFKARAVDLLGSNPFADAGHLDELAELAGFADRRERDQVVAEAVAKKREAAQLESRLMHLERQRNRKGLDEAQRRYFDAEIAKVQGQRVGKSDTAAPPAAPVSPVVEAAVAPAGVSAPASLAAPKAGDENDGYRFKGGDPSDKANWEKL